MTKNTNEMIDATLDKILEGVPKEMADILKRETIRGIDNFLKMCPIDQSPVLSILRVHLLTEYSIERAFQVLLPRADKITDVSLSYAQKLALLESLDEFDDRTIQCLKNLNRVRNRCAHEYDKTLTAADVELIGRPLGKEHTEIRNANLEDVGKYLHEVLSAICRGVNGQIICLEHKEQLSEQEQE